jgi:hypothetical protein
MRVRIKLRHVTTILLFPCLLLVTSCSRATLFVVVNKSERSVEVRYRVKGSSGDVRVACSTPAVDPVSELDSDKPWRELSASEYQVDEANRSITVSLKPEEVLRIVVIRSPENAEEEATAAETFCVEEIVLSGAHGEIKLAGKQVYPGFVPESRKTRKLIYY